MNEFSMSKKIAAVVVHQMFIVLMICSLYGIGYCMSHRVQGMGYLNFTVIFGLAGSFVTLAYLTGITGRKSEKDPTVYLTRMDKVYTDVELLLFIAVILFVIRLGRNLRNVEMEFSALLVTVGTISYLIDSAFLLIYLSIVRRSKNGTFLTYSLIYTFFDYVLRIFRTGKSPVLCTRKAMERYEIQRAIESIASGALDTRLDEERFHGQDRDIACAVNHIRDGLKEAVEERIKNERMKADLITNVSHDIKTPLTSIVNYVDLLKRENLNNENAQRYIRVLDDKSQRLKQLTEDLVEASKISSGNVKLDMHRIDLLELLYQTGGEFNERFEARNLTIVTKLPHESVYVEADGRQLYRAIENLYTNAAKYAMENTRVYVELEHTDDRAIFTIKNVSKVPLLNREGAEPDLTARFVRGEQSRTTEGSGLGLSIAKNLTILMGGEFELKLDGDLFIAKIIFHTLK